MPRCQWRGQLYFEGAHRLAANPAGTAGANALSARRHALRHLYRARHNQRRGAARPANERNAGAARSKRIRCCWKEYFTVKTRSSSAWFWLILANVLWATSYAAAKFALRDLSVTMMLALRLGISALLLLPFLLWHYRSA